MSPAERQTLLDLAKAALKAAVNRLPLPEVPPDLSPGLAQPAGAFVTLNRGKRLRGCIGLMQSEAPLAETVVAMAESAALHDPRFAPVSPAELPELRLEISVLSPLKRVASAEDIALGRDGVLVRRGRRSGVFLPQVAQETGWSKEKFLCELCGGKAGLEPDAWKGPDVELYTFQVALLATDAEEHP
ncbi:MAG: AmmeMemoRadiSam system protein A [Candidatus Firestonebacteria bacterium]|nr:AmmeMemoRadiSam system protein A [Candidatus Firestonebacteria bacterium]